MNWIYEQLASILEELINSEVQNFFLGIVTKIKLNHKLKKVTKQLTEFLVEEYGDRVYYNRLDNFLNVNQIVSLVIRHCLETKEFECSIYGFAKEQADKFLCENIMFEENRNEIIELLNNLFSGVFEILNDIDDENIQSAINILKDKMHQHGEEMKIGFKKILSEEREIKKGVEEANEGIKELLEVNKICSMKEFKEILEKEFAFEKENNPSIEKVVSEILPKGIVIEREITVKVNREKVVPLKEYFKETWESKVQSHISITGIGGIGKTIVLFDTIYPVPTIYVPLRNLSFSSNCGEEYIMEYIKEKTLHGKESVIQFFHKLCNESWKDGPNIILLLDGMNEIVSSKLDAVMNEVRVTWLRKEGVQLIVTSRYHINNKIYTNKMNQVVLELLSEDIIETYLIDRGIELPEKSSKVWDVIDTPLMLRLFTESEVMKHSYDSDFATWRDNINAGSIIWNYLQSELSKLDGQNKLESVVAIHFVAPFICYKMMKAEIFIISEEAFCEYISMAIDLYNQLRKENKLPKMISITMHKTSLKKVRKENFYSLLLSNFRLFYERDKKIQLVHQHFRDCLAAIYIMQVCEKVNRIPKEWKEPFDQYVMEFIADLLVTEVVDEQEKNTWKRVWGYGYQKEQGTQEFTKKMLCLYKKAYGVDISEINFQGVDLTDISLNSFQLSEKSKNHFKNAVISRNTFFGTGHSDTVCAVSWSCDNTYYISASHDCSIRVYDVRTNKNNILEKYHMHYIRCAKCSPTNAQMIASAGDDQQLIGWESIQKVHKNGQVVQTWIPKVWGECSDWIRSLAWNVDGNKIVCGDGKGNIKLFDGETSIIFEKKHYANVRHLVWSTVQKNRFASGADDGTVCIWYDTGECRKQIKLDSAITSIAWLQKDTIFIVSTLNKVYFYEISSSIQIEKIKEIVRKGVSYIAVLQKREIDYLAIFDSKMVEILSMTYSDNVVTLDEVGLYCYAEETNKIISAEWNSTGDTLICGSRDGSVSKIQVLKNEEDKERIIFQVIGRKCNKAARCSSWSPNGKWLAVGYDDCRIRIWDFSKRRCVAVLKGHMDSIKCLSWSPDNRRLVSGSDDNMVRLWEGESITTLIPKTIVTHKGPVNVVLWLKDNIIVSAGDDASVVFTNMEEKSVVKQVHTQRIYGLAVSPDENYMVSGGNDDYICLWDMHTLEYDILKSGHLAPIRAMAWSSDGMYVISSSNDYMIHVRTYDFEKHRLYSTYEILPRQHDDFIYGATISGNNNYVIGGSTDSTVGFWKIDTKEFLYKSKAHKGFIWNVSASPNIDGKYYIATSSSDGTVKIWDVSDTKKDEIEPIFDLPVIPESDIVGCDFSGVVIKEEHLKEEIIANGGLF